MNNSVFEVTVFDHKENKEVLKKRLTIEEAIVMFTNGELKLNELKMKEK